MHEVWDRLGQWDTKRTLTKNFCSTYYISIKYYIEGFDHVKVYIMFMGVVTFFLQLLNVRTDRKKNKKNSDQYLVGIHYKLK